MRKVLMRLRLFTKKHSKIWIPLQIKIKKYFNNKIKAIKSNKRKELGLILFVAWIYVQTKDFLL